jgi:hypothetical protein
MPFLMRRLGFFSLAHCANTVGPCAKMAVEKIDVGVATAAYQSAFLAMQGDVYRLLVDNPQWFHLSKSLNLDCAGLGGA